MRAPEDELGDAALPAHLHPRGLRAGRAAARTQRRPSGAAGRRPSVRRGVVILRLVAALVSLSVLTGTGYAWASYRHFTSGVKHVDAIPGAPGGKDIDGVAQNILLVGDDHRPDNASPQELALLSTGQDGGGTNTDTMMVLHLPGGGGNPTVISFPRDSWVDIPGVGKGKLNSAFSAGAANGADAAGMRLLIQTIQNMTGLSIDHFVRVSMVGFYDIANVLGPIQVCLNQPAHDGYSGTNLPAGVSTLDAKQALSFVRQRHGLLRGDLDREVRQQYFLSTELHKVLSAGTLLNPSKTQSLLGAVSSALETDPGLDLLSLATEFHGLSADKVTYTTIPVTGTPTIQDAQGNEISIVSVDFAALPGFINQVLGTPGSSSSAPGNPSTAKAAPPVDPSTVTVQVVNGTGRPGLAAAQSAALGQLGFRTEPPTNGDSTTATTITFPPGLQAQAQAVAAHVPGARVQASTAGSPVTLVLGSDGLQVSDAGGTGQAPAASGSASSASAPTQSFTTSSCIN